MWERVRTWMLRNFDKPDERNEPDDVAMEITADVGPWETLKIETPTHEKVIELSREYRFTNLAGPGTKTRIDLRCRLVQQKDGSAKPTIYLIVSPRMVERSKLVPAFFCPCDDPLNYEILSATVAVPNEPTENVTYILFEDQDKANYNQLLKVLMLGRPITFRLIDLCDVVLENDDTFQPAYQLLSMCIRGGLGTTPVVLNDNLMTTEIETSQVDHILAYDRNGEANNLWFPPSNCQKWVIVVREESRYSFGDLISLNVSNLQPCSGTPRNQKDTEIKASQVDYILAYDRNGEANNLWFPPSNCQKWVIVVRGESRYSFGELVSLNVSNLQPCSGNPRDQEDLIPR